MRRRFDLPTVLVVSLVSSCAAPSPREAQAPVQTRAQTPVALPLFDEAGRPNIGSLEHRGRQYDLRDLMDPETRRRGDSDFLRNFDAHDMYAGLWAGL